MRVLPKMHSTCPEKRFEGENLVEFLFLFEKVFWDVELKFLVFFWQKVSLGLSKMHHTCLEEPF